MVCLNDLPNEILEKIIMEIPKRPFKTELLLLNKMLCYLFMNEQVKNLQLLLGQLYSWITIIEGYDVKTPRPELRYRNLLNKVVSLNIDINGDTDLSKEPIARFITYCKNIRAFLLGWPSLYRLRWDTSLIFDSLPSNIIEITISNISTGGRDEKGIYHLISYMKRNTNLKKLIINKNDIGFHGACALAEVLKQNTALTSLDLKHNDIGTKGTHALAEALKQNTVLTNLDISFNDIGVEGGRALAEALKQNTALISLFLRHNGIGDGGSHALAEALKLNTTLTNLDLSGNNIHIDGAHALAKALKQNSALATLNIQWNGIGDDGVHALAEALKENTTLIDLELGHYIHYEGGRIIRRYLERNRTLTIYN